MHITREEIEIIFRLVLKKLDFDEFREINLDEDEYWIIAADEWHNLEHAPDPGVGSLTEDCNSLKQSIKDNAIYTYSDLDRLASILRAISEYQAPTNQ